MNKKKILKLVLVILIIVNTVFISLNLDILTNFNILKGTGEFSYPSFILVNEEGNKYFINNSLTQVLVLDKNDNYLFEINGGKNTEKGFNFVNNIAVDKKGYIYISDVSYNSHYDRDEQIKLLRYKPNGSFDRILYNYTYECDDNEKPYIHSSFMTLEYYNGRIYYAQRDFNSFSMFSIASDGSETEPRLERRYDYENAGLLIADFALDIPNNTIYISTKKGDIFKASDEEFELIYDGGNFNGFFNFYEVPNEISINNDASKLFYTDIGTREVYSIDLKTFEKQTILESDKCLTLDEQEIYYRINTVINSKDTVSVCASSGNYYICQDGNTISSNCEFYYNVSTIIKFIALWIGILIIASFLFYMLCKLVIYTFNSEKGELIQTYILIFTAIMVIFISVTSILINSTSERYYNSILSSTYSISKLTAELIDGDILERINTPDDYMNEDYQIIRNQLHSAYSGNDQDMDSTYCVLYKLKNDVVYYTLHLSDDSGVVYPDELTYEESDFKTISELNAPLTYSEVETGDGEWMYTTSPIYNSKGKIVAVCEVGKNRVTYSQANKQMILEVLINVSSLTVVVFLIFSELVNFINILKQRIKNSNENKPYNDLLLVDFTRIYAFIIYAADNFTSVIIPLMSQKLYNPNSVLPESIAIALPLSAQSFSMAISGFFAGQLSHKIGTRKCFIGGIILHIVGLTMCALSTSIPMFSLSMFIVGMGMGTNSICLNSYIIVRKDNDEKSRGFSLLTAGTFAGTNCGVIIGTLISEQHGYSYVFFVSAAVAVLVLILVLTLYKKDYDAQEEDCDEEEISKISLLSFLTKIKVIGYFIFAMTPYIIFASFVFYFLPLYASEQGVSESRIGLITLAYGIGASYLSPLLTKLIVEKLGSRFSLILASLLTAASLILFIISPTVGALIFVVIIMGIADSFLYPAVSMYISEIH